MKFIEFKNVTKQYRSGDKIIKALDNISFEIEKESFTVILGPSGSGKSTMLNLIGGMDRVTDGTIIVDDVVITDLSKKELNKYRREKVGFVFQFYNLIPNLNAFENVDIVKKLSTSPLNPSNALEKVGLIERKKNFPDQMSGGELQRVAIARALCKNTGMLLCDEPTGALDSETGKRILMLLQEMVIENKATVIVVTHNAAIAPAADRIIKLRDGKIQDIINNEAPIEMNKIDW